MKENVKAAPVKYLPGRPTQTLKGRALRYFLGCEILLLEIFLVTFLDAVTRNAANNSKDSSVLNVKCPAESHCTFDPQLVELLERTTISLACRTLVEVGHMMGRL